MLEHHHAGGRDPIAELRRIESRRDRLLQGSRIAARLTGRVAFAPRPRLVIEVRRARVEAGQHGDRLRIRTNRQLRAAQVRPPGRDPRRQRGIEHHRHRVRLRVHAGLQRVHLRFVLRIDPAQLQRLHLRRIASGVEVRAAQRQRLVAGGDGAGSGVVKRGRLGERGTDGEQQAQWQQAHGVCPMVRMRDRSVWRLPGRLPYATNPFAATTCRGMSGE